jgi:hypothetical protein
MTIVYPVSRLLAEPKVFGAISNYLGGPGPDILRSTVLEMLELGFEELEIEEASFDAEEVMFDVEMEGEKNTFIISLDTGLCVILKEEEGGGNLSEINNASELSTAFALHRRLISAIEDSNPELKDDISLDSPPTPGNNYLSSGDGDHFVGVLHLRSNPDKRYSFSVQVIDPESDQLKATIKPI